MSHSLRAPLAFAFMAAMLLMVGFGQSWSVSLGILNLCLISAVMALGVNIQWGYAGLFNAGVMASTALGGLAAVLISHSPVTDAWAAGGVGIVVSLLLMVATVMGLSMVKKGLPKGIVRTLLMLAVFLLGLVLVRRFFAESTVAIEAVNPAKTGFLGGLGLPILFSWVAGGLLAAAVAWMVGKITLGLRSDYLAIATLGISEIVIAVLKNEDWLARGVKNVSGLKRPVPYEVDLQNSEWFITLIQSLNGKELSELTETTERNAMLSSLLVESSSVFVKLCYAGLFSIVLVIILGLSIRALNSPWGRMMRAIRDREDAASAMGKNVKARHLEVFVLGSAVVGIAGAMLTTLDGQFTPGTYQPLRFTFLVWVMVIVGGSGNNLGSVLGGFLVWFFWIEAEPMSVFIISNLTSGLDASSALKQHLIESAPHLRLFLMGLVLLLVMRFSPKGILPEQVRHA